jgi:alpha-aminoadipate carrier protein LysW
MPQCPECDAAVDVDEDDVEEGEVVSCPECGVDLEVIGTNPLELNLLEDDEEEEEPEDGAIPIRDEEDEDEDEDDEEEER